MDRKGSRKKTAGQAEETERVETVAPAAPRAPDPRPEPARAAPPPAPRVDPLRRPASPPAPPARPGLPARSPASPAAPAAPRSFFSPIIEVGAEEEVEHRHFPRARLATNFELWIDEEGDRRFTATLRSANVSVGGAFLESTFFLPMDTELRVRFSLEPGAAPVEARALIVREQRPRREDEPTGFGIRFEEFYGQTEVSLARLFLDMRLRTFAEDYLRSNRARGLPNELERVVDALAAWELLKANNPTDTWRGE
ncbi:PilZ domain-containing protein [Archangium lansingense]|uniref:PilZ domain-containing protein n=1 Tax=Archangium lansingense TaxID=2995310 RepID=A0ABT4A4K2_9BACT|nr:PilZ domain-containing protein [Archangium lansinium]MCY1076574.1 PilZ domain-containing protein [Archangium lansinium]